MMAAGGLFLSGLAFSEPAYAFRSRLETVHEPGRRDAAAAPRADEFVFRDGCRVPTADFADYLDVSMGVRATVDAAKGDVTVVLDRALREREYTVDVGASGVAIRAYDERARDQALYHLEDLMNLRRAPFLAFGRARRRMRYSPRMTHSGWGLDKFPDAHLRQLAHQGFDAILLFLTGVDETQGGGKGAGINDIVDRALRAGLDTYLYSKVPVFAHPDNPEGARKLRETFGAIAAAHPRAKGIVFVGESAEFPSRDERTCGLSLYQERPKDETRPLPGWYPCRDYPDWLKAVQTALHEKSPGLEIVFWTYNWSDCPPEQGADLLKRFPPEVAIESTFGPGEVYRYRNGLEVVTKDYTLSVPGPNRHFELEAAAAAAGKRKLYAMSNTGGLTWDYGVVPYQPCPYQWKRRWDALNATDGLVGLMESHHFGCWPSFVTELAKEAFTEGGLPVEDCLRRIAARDFGEANVEDVLSVWRDWSDAAADYAATNENQYGPFRLGPAYPFNFGGKPIAEGEFPQGKGATHVMRWMAYLNYPYDKAAADSLNVTYEHLSPEDRRKDLELLQAMREKWMAGATRLRRIARTLDANRRRNGERLADLGEWHARTVSTAIALRRGQAAFAAGDRRALVAVAAEERRNAVAALALAERDSRLGWEPSMEYVGGPGQLRWKIALIDRLYGFEMIKQKEKSDEENQR